MNKPKFIINADGTVESYHPDKIVPPKKEADFSRPSIQPLVRDKPAIKVRKRVRCLICHKRVARNEILDHLRSAHVQQISEIETVLSEIEISSDPLETMLCPFCQVTVKAKNFASHMNKVHGLSTSTTLTKQPVVNIPTEHKLVPCPHCQSQVRSDRLERHIRKVHSKPFNTSTPVDHKHKNKKSTAPMSNELVPCPHCKAQVRPERLEQHIHKAHSRLSEVSRSLTRCPECQDYVRAEFLQDHIETVHRKKVVRCHLCLTQMRANRMADHLTKVHGVKPPKGKDKAQPDHNLLSCPFCQNPIRANSLQDHLVKAHADKLADISPSSPTPSPPPSSPRKTGTSRRKATFDPGSGSANAVYESFHEPRDGSKGLGHMRRDFNGTFGSYPLHDDYSDESSAD